MDWTALIFFAIGIGIMVYMYLRSQSSAPVAVEHQVANSEGGIEAIEYFWRPG